MENREDTSFMQTTEELDEGTLFTLGEMQSNFAFGLLGSGGLSAEHTEGFVNFKVDLVVRSDNTPTSEEIPFHRCTERDKQSFFELNELANRNFGNAECIDGIDEIALTRFTRTSRSRKFVRISV